MGRELRRIPVKDLVANPRNVREHLDGIDDLAASIHANGVLQPLIVNDRAGSLEVVDGHRRLAAAQRAGVERLVCIVETDADDRRVLTLMLAAAMHRELKPIEQAKAFRRLKSEGVTTGEISRTTGYSLALVRHRLTLLDLPVEAQRMLEDKTLTIAQATDLAKQVKAKRSGSVATKKKQARHFDSAHHLSGRVMCTHHETRAFYGGIGCGPCWEKAIRDDERARMAREAVAS